MLSFFNSMGVAAPPVPKIVLHVGMPKTATSSFYAFLRAKRYSLEKRGILYPRLQAETGKALSQNDTAWLLSSGREGQRNRARAALGRALEQAREYNLLFLGSENLTKYGRADDGQSHETGARHVVKLMHAGAEEYWTRRDRYIADLAEILRPAPVELWIVLRRRDRFAESIYRQALLNRNYVGTISDLISSPFALLDYERIIEQYARFFPVRLFIYEDLVAEGGGDAVRALARELGAGDLAERKGASYRVNVGYNPEVLEYIRRLNHFPVPEKRQLVRRLVQWAAQSEETFEGVSLLSTEERLELIERFRESDERIMQAYSLGLRRESLFPAEGIGGGSKYQGMTNERFRYICRQVFPDVIGATETPPTA